jgi:hypothetical protein
MSPRAGKHSGLRVCLTHPTIPTVSAVRPESSQKLQFRYRPFRDCSIDLISAVFRADPNTILGVTDFLWAPLEISPLILLVFYAMPNTGRVSNHLEKIQEIL